MAGLIASDLLSSIRRRASIPSSSATGSADSDLLAYANEELQFELVAELLKLREEYFARDYDYTLDGSTTAYRIPPRAIGGKLRHVFLLDSAGAVIAKLSRTEPDDSGGTDEASAFFVRNNHVVLAPSATTTATTLRLGYYIRPNDITATAADYEVVTGVTGNALTVASGHGYTTSSVLDIVKGTPGYEHALIATSPSATAATTITFGTGDGLTGLGVAVGDYICTQEKSPYPQIPPEFHPVLAQRVACRYLEAQKDTEGLASATKKLEKMEAAVGLLVAPRVETSPQKIVSGYSAAGALGVRRG